jgi:hypothetical protein
MAFPRTQWYVNSVAHAATTAWATGAVIAAGALRRQLAAPAVGSERIFAAIVAGTTHATTEPTWVVTRGAKTTDNTVTWQEVTGQAAVNGDLTNTVAWSNATVKNTALTLGTIIKNVAATHLFILSTAGTAGNGAEPTWGTTAGNTTVDNTCTWTCLGPVGSFTAGLAPHARLANALASTWAVAGDFICIGDNSAETQAATITLANTSATPFYVICHNHSGSYPPTSSDLTTGATLTTSSTGSTINVSAVAIYMSGVELIASGANGFLNPGATTSSSAGHQRYKNCKFTLSGGGQGIFMGSIGASATAPYVHTDNCTFSFSSTGAGLFLQAVTWLWENSATALAGSAVPTNLLKGINGTAQHSDVLIRGVDLSPAGSSKNLIGGAFAGRCALLDCKINASVTVSANPFQPGVVDLINCDSGAVNYRNERHTYAGDLTTETTIVRTGGASDGITPAAGKIVTTANSLIWQYPFEAPPIAIWNETTGSAITVTLYGIWGAGVVPNNDEFWIDVAYLGSTLTPIASLATSGKADILASNAALTSDSSTWGGSTTKFKTSVTITPQQKGYIYVTPKMAKASTTLYYDTKLLVA